MLKNKIPRILETKTSTTPKINTRKDSWRRSKTKIKVASILRKK